MRSSVPAASSVRSSSAEPLTASVLQFLHSHDAITNVILTGQTQQAHAARHKRSARRVTRRLTTSHRVPGLRAPSARCALRRSMGDAPRFDAALRSALVLRAQRRISAHVEHQDERYETQWARRWRKDTDCSDQALIALLCRAVCVLARFRSATGSLAHQPTLAVASLQARNARSTV